MVTKSLAMEFKTNMHAYIHSSKQRKEARGMHYGTVPAHIIASPLVKSMHLFEQHTKKVESILKTDSRYLNHIPSWWL